MNKGMYITDREILSIISEESDKFKKYASREILGKKVSEISMRVLSKIDASFESMNLKLLIGKHFRDSIATNIKPNLVKALENGGNGSNFIEQVGCLINKYVSQESYYRSNELKKKYALTSSKDLDRKEVIADISRSFESVDLQLELSESFSEEFNAILIGEENDIIDGASKEIKVAIDDAEQKAEVSRVIINEFSELAKKAKDAQDAMKPAEPVVLTDETGAHLTSYEVIKAKIPVSVERFNLENEKGSFTKHKFVDMLLTLEDITDNFANDKDFIQKRINAIRTDAVSVKDFDVTKVDNLEDLYKSAVKDVDGKFSAFRELGFGRGDLPAFKNDPETLSVIKSMSELTAKDDAKRINDLEILAQTQVSPIVNPNEFIKTAVESFELRSAMGENVGDFEKHRDAIRVRDEALGEYLIDGMKHIPAAQAERLEEIHSGLKKLAYSDGLRQMHPERLKSIYYKTAKVVDPGVFVDFKVESERVKEMIAKNYNTDKFSGVVDDFFDQSGHNKTNVSEENLYELTAYKAALEISTENGGKIDEQGKKNIKAYAAVFSSYLKTLENLLIVDKNDIKQYARKITS